MPKCARLLVAVLVAATTWLAFAPPADAATVAVSIQDFSFQPPSVTVTPGTTVTWTNHDQTEHSVTSDHGTFDSGNGLCPPAHCIAPGTSYSFTFARPGTYAYHCNIHTYMHGTVTVASASTTTSSPPTTTRPPQTTAPGRTGNTTSTTGVPTVAAPSLPPGATLPTTLAPGETSTMASTTTTGPGSATDLPSKAPTKHTSHTARTVLIVIAALLLLIGAGALVGRLSRDRRVT